MKTPLFTRLAVPQHDKSELGTHSSVTMAFSVTLRAMLAGAGPEECKPFGYAQVLEHAVRSIT